MVTKNQLEEIKKFADELEFAAFGGKSKGNQHFPRIAKIARALGKNQDVDLTLVEAAAWLHDTGLEKTITGSTLSNKEKVVTFLTELGVSEHDQETILHCIEAHDGRVPAQTVEAKIIHDADTLEKSGSLGVIRETWKRAQMGWTTEKIANHLQTHLKKREKNLQLDEAKTRANELNKSLFKFLKTLDKQINLSKSEVLE